VTAPVGVYIATCFSLIGEDSGPTAAVWVDVAAHLGLRGWTLWPAATIRIDVATYFYADALKKGPNAAKDLHPGRYDLKGRWALGLSSRGRRPRHGEGHDQEQEDEGLATIRDGEHGGSLESAPPRPPWPRGQPFRESGPNPYDLCPVSWRRAWRSEGIRTFCGSW
jgi:hypothetical protein